MSLVVCPCLHLVLVLLPQYFAEGRDLQHLSEQTKVVWASSPPLFLFKPRDYCTIVHYRKQPDGTIIGTTRYTGRQTQTQSAIRWQKAKAVAFGLAYDGLIDPGPQW